jgi:putative transposase
MSRARGPGRRSVGQLSLAFPARWGGARKRAGRKAGPRPNVAHRARPAHAERHPLHVTLRAQFRGMRTQRVFAALSRALRRSARRAPERFRVVQFSIQADHIHLLVEAAGKAALSRGVQGLCISMARRVNRVLQRRGRFWADRFHARALESPRAVRNALVYILANFRKHAGRRFAAGIDCFSSAAFFDGWFATPRQHELIHGLSFRIRGAPASLHAHLRQGTVTFRSAHAHRSEGHTVVPARTWLARVGWRRHGLISLTEQPARPE